MTTRASARVVAPMLATCGALLVVAFCVQFASYGRGGHASISDVPRLVVSRGITPAHWPYLDRALEYPIAAGLLLGAAVTISPSPMGALVVTAIAASIVALALTWFLARSFGSRAWRWALATPLLLYAFQNWDLFAIFALVLGLLAFERGRDGQAGVAIGVGAAVKLFPLVVVPALAAIRWGEGDRRGAYRVVGGALGTFAVLNAPVLLARPHSWWWTYTFQSARQATWGSAWFYVLRIAGVPVHGAFGAHIANAASAIALAGSIAWLVACVARRRLDALAAAGAAVALFVLCNKVYSPTYDLWLVAFFVMIPLGRRLWVLFCAVDLAVFLVVYGYFDGPLSVDVVRAVLPALVVVRTTVVLTVVARATATRRPAVTATPVLSR